MAAQYPVLRTRHGPLRIVGGAHILDLLNTIDTRHGRRIDFLASYEDLAKWAGATGLLEGRLAKELAKRATRRPRLAASALGRTLELREAARNYLHDRPSVKARCSKGDDLAALLGIIAEAMEPRAGGPAFRLSREPLREPLFRLAAETLWLFSTAPAGWIDRCAQEDCGWYFMDRQTRRPRAWCSMPGCGNKAKARRHRERARLAKA